MEDNNIIKKTIDIKQGILEVTNDKNLNHSEIIHVTNNDPITSKDYNTIQKVLTEALIKHDHFSPVKISFENAIDGKKYEYNYRFQPPPYILDTIVINCNLEKSEKSEKNLVPLPTKAIDREDIKTLLANYNLSIQKITISPITFVIKDKENRTANDKNKNPCFKILLNDAYIENQAYTIVVDVSQLLNVKVEELAITITMEVKS